MQLRETGLPGDRCDLINPVSHLRPPRARRNVAVSVSVGLLPTPRGWRVYSRFLHIHHPAPSVLVWHNGRNLLINHTGHRFAKGLYDIATFKSEARVPWINALPWAHDAVELASYGYQLSLSTFYERGAPRVSYDQRYDVCLPEPHHQAWERLATKCTHIFRGYDVPDSVHLQ